LKYPQKLQLFYDTLLGERDNMHGIKEDAIYTSPILYDFTKIKRKTEDPKAIIGFVHPSVSRKERKRKNTLCSEHVVNFVKEYIRVMFLKDQHWSQPYRRFTGSTNVDTLFLHLFKKFVSLWRIPGDECSSIFSS